MSNPAAQTPPENEWLFNPRMDNPDEAKGFVILIFKHKPDNIDLVAADLVPLFGFGPNSNQDPLARIKAQSVFTSPEVTYALKEFLNGFTYAGWGLDVAKWHPTWNLVRLHRNDKDRKLPLVAPFSKDPLEQYYARFIILMLSKLEEPYSGNMMLQWLRDAMHDDRIEEVSWVLFHALMYLQLKAMDLNKARASLKEWAQHYLHKFKTGK